MKPTKKDFIAFFKSRAGRPLLVREIMRQFKLKADDRHDLKQMLAGLVAEGNIVKSRGNRYGATGGTGSAAGKAARVEVEQGLFQAHPSGFGFVMPGIKGKTDVFVPAGGRRDAMDGDTVKVRVSPPSGKKKAAGDTAGAAQPAN